MAGVTATERALLDALRKHGVHRIDPALGEPFDPHRHQAMFELESSGVPVVSGRIGRRSSVYPLGGSAVLCTEAG
jgi:hypothetical protein